MSQNNSPRASDLFWDAIINAGTGVVECGFCGRTHFTLDGDYDLSRDEAADLLRKHRHNPEQYVQHHGDSISWGYLDGKQAVYECSCDKVRKYEQSFWNSRHVIAKYFTAKAKALTDLASDTQNLASKVAEATE